MLGFILSGGAARGAYEAGVLRFLLDTLPRRMGVRTEPDVICGTSIGAMTAAWVGACGGEGAARLSNIWQTLVPEQVYRFGSRDLLRVPGMLLAAQGAEPGALFDPAPLRALLDEKLPWGDLHANLDSGRLRGLVVSATDVASGQCTLFSDGVPVNRTTPTIRSVHTRIGPEHCLASAAIPLVFPAVQVRGRYYVDGGLRQNTPISPAVALGVTHALVIGVKRPPRVVDEGELPSPTPIFLAGKALDALMLDPIEEDLRRLDRINGLLDWASSAYPDFLQRLEREHRPYRRIATFHLRPDADLGALAAEAFRQNVGKLPWATRVLLRSIYREESPKDADLLSYLFFHHSYTHEVEALGYADAERHEESLARFLSARAAA